MVRGFFMKKLILIRHGETGYTEQRRYCGHNNTPLNSKGIKQAIRLRSKLKKIKIDKIYSSDLRRACQTAKIIFKNRLIIKKRNLREIDFGAFVGLTWKESSQRYPSIYKTWLNNPLYTKIPNGESVSKFKKRIEKCFANMLDQNQDKTVALVCHGGPIRIIILKILKQDMDKFWNIEQDIACINIIEFKNGIPQVLKINDTSHLE